MAFSGNVVAHGIEAVNIVVRAYSQIRDTSSSRVALRDLAPVRAIGRTRDVGVHASFAGHATSVNGTSIFVGANGGSVDARVLARKSRRIANIGCAAVAIIADGDVGGVSALRNAVR